MNPSNDSAEPHWTDVERAALHQEIRQLSLSLARQRATPPADNRSKFFALSSQWAKRSPHWTKSGRQLWKKLLRLCREIEEDALRQAGVPVKRIKELVREEFAWWDSSADDFKFSPDCPENIPTVPVITSFKDAVFRIHSDIYNLLWDHPLLIDEIEKSGPKNQRAKFCRILERIESIAKAHDLHDWETIPNVAQQDSPDRLAANCMMAGVSVRHALGSIYGMDFLDDLRNAPEESGSTDARSLGQICVLLNAAIQLGSALERYAFSQNSRVEDVMRKLAEMNPGRGASPEGEAVLKIVKAFMNEKSAKPTANKLLNFLGVKTPLKKNEPPLPVNHPLWTEVLKSVSWNSFKTLVQSANRRL